MRTATGRPARIVCVVLAVLSLGGAVILLSDAVSTDDPETAGRVAALAPVLAMGSIMWMLGALVATAAASVASRTAQQAPAPVVQPQYAPAPPVAYAQPQPQYAPQPYAPAPQGAHPEQSAPVPQAPAPVTDGAPAAPAAAG